MRIVLSLVVAAIAAAPAAAGTVAAPETVRGVAIEAGASAKPGVRSTQTFAALEYACYGGKTVIQSSEGKCLSEESWSNFAQKKCAKSCTKVQGPGGRVTLKCGVNSFQTLKPCQ